MRWLRRLFRWLRPKPLPGSDGSASNEQALGTALGVPGMKFK